ncbi:DUF6112 family protein [Nesterenkonia alkaliphila]|nr:DUF6112 family protein [Nesterenkonia alkaliphila]GFZ83192.1 hypothetical protein GCM10011359_09880 [Nesterenkonia alkaliphila]
MTTPPLAPMLSPTSSMRLLTGVGASVFPDFDAVGGSDLILEVLGALLTVVLVFSLLMLLISIIAWALGASSGNAQVATRGRTGVLVALGGAALSGGAVVWMNFLIDVGGTI